MTFNPTITLIADGESVDAAVTNAPLNQLLANTLWLQARVLAMTNSTALFLYNVPIAPGAQVGQPLYWDSVHSRYDLAKADGTVKENVVGSLFALDGSSQADVLIGGFAALDITVAVGGAPANARYWLSTTTAGMLTATQPATPSVLVCWADGLGNVMAMPQISDNTGPAGPTGPTGSILRNGSGVPSNGLGINGDYYLDVSGTGNLYYKAAGAYTVVANLLGPAGIQGPNGTTWRTGAGVPSNGLGANGDFYLDIDTGNVYSKSGGVYTLDTNISGPPGPQGPGEPPGGLADQPLVKVDGTNLNTRWGGWTRRDATYNTITTDTDSGTITFDASVGDLHQVQLGGNRTLAVANDKNGQEFTIILQQPASGGPYTVTWWSGILWKGGSAPTLSTGASKRDRMKFQRLSTGVYLGIADLSF